VGFIATLKISGEYNNLSDINIKFTLLPSPPDRRKALEEVYTMADGE